MILQNKMNILLVEDDAILSGEIRQFLEKWGYMARETQQFEDILSEFTSNSCQLVLMDINLPFYDGFYWCSRIREISNVPIIFISSRSDDRDKIMGIAQGGDDYIEKPFHLELLKAKIEAVLRRTYQYRVKDRIYLNQELSFEIATKVLTYRDTPVELTKSEQKIMAKLAEKRPEVVTRDELMMELWSTDEFVSDGTLTTIICRLRNKLRGACGSEIIVTKKGMGYLIE